MPDYFNGWLEATKDLERQRMEAGKKGAEASTFEGFGRSDVGGDGEAWEQFTDYVNDLLDGGTSERDDDDD